MTQKFAIAARAALTSNIGPTDTSLTVEIARADLFPVADTGTSPVGTAGKDWFKVVLEDANHNIEIVYVRSRALLSASMTNLLRGQEGTTARSYLAGSIVGLRHTAVDIEDAINLADVATDFGRNLIASPNETEARAILGTSSPVENRVINGAMEISQENGSSAISANGSPVDMFNLEVDVSGKLSAQQVADAPPGLKFSTKITVLATVTPTTESLNISTAIEGKNIVDYKLGTSGAITFTLSMWMKASVAGNYPVAFVNADGTRSYVTVVAVTTDWTQPKVTLAGDVAGTWATDNQVGMFIVFDLGSSAFRETTANAWQSTLGNMATRTTDSIRLVSQAVGSTLQITGVDCRPGSIAPAVFGYRDDELERCQRYVEKCRANISFTASAASAKMGSRVYFKRTKRATPTVTNQTLVSSTNSSTASTPLGIGTDGFNVASTAVASGATEFIADYTAQTKMRTSLI